MTSLETITRAARYWARTSGVDEALLEPNCSCCGHDDLVPDPAAWRDLYPHLSDEDYLHPLSSDLFVDPWESVPGIRIDWEALDYTCGYDVRWFWAWERYSYERERTGNPK